MTQGYKTSEIAQRYGVSHQTAYSWIRKGKIKSSRIGGHFRVSEADLLAYEEAARNWWMEDFHA